jgi:CheY-like chemotaxis protein
MNFLLHNIGRFLVGFLLSFLFASTALFAQDEDTTLATPPAAEATPKPDATKPAEKSDDAFGKSSVLPSNPAVAALLAANPTTPNEMARTAKILVDLHEPALAKQFLKKIVDANLDQAKLAALGRELGSPMFVAFAGNEALQPHGKQLSDAVIDAMNAELQDPKKIAEAIEQLRDPSFNKRVKALEELRHARKPAIAALVEVLADPKRESEFANVREALCSMGRPAFNQMIGIMQTADPQLKEQAIRVLGEAVAIDAKYFLFAPALEQSGRGEKETAVTAAARQALARLTGGKLPTKSEAVKLLVRAAGLYLHRQPPLPDAVDGQVEIWSWDNEKRKTEVVTLPVEDARLLTAARLAHDALKLDPNNREARWLYETATLEGAAYKNGLDKPLDEESILRLLEMEPKNLQDLLYYSLETKHYPAAATALGILSFLGKIENPLNPPSGESVLIKAVEQPDRRLRLAALRAIVSLKPEQPYPGSSKVLDALAYFAAGSGTRKAIVAGPNLNNIPKLVSGLSAAGFAVDTANTGNEVLQKLLASPDYEVVMIDAGISQPPIDILLQQIRRDNRSADVRVGVVARAGFFEKAEHVASGDPLSIDFARPNDDDASQWEVAQLTAIKPRELVRPDERLSQAGEALDLLAKMSTDSPKLYDLRRVQNSLLLALKTPSLAPKAVAVLANLNSLEAQQTLVAVASRDTAPIEVRQAAADAFRANVQANGLLLGEQEVRRQYDLYNKSETADKATQKVLGLILDCLEAPKK